VKKIGEQYQALSKYARDRKLDSYPPETVTDHKKYVNVPVIHLPEPNRKGGGGLWGILSKRRSRRGYPDSPLSIENLSQLLWASQGMTDTEDRYALRTAPSAGALYPVETYLFARNISGLKPGIYHYAVLRHALELVKDGDFTQKLQSAGMDQMMFSSAAVTFAWSAVFARSRNKYKDRAYRYIYMDCGHIAQNLGLACECLSLGFCPIGAFYDDEINDLVGLDGENESVIYLATAGKSS
jgi:SagB-type dehydrogenase family enzyme